MPDPAEPGTKDGEVAVMMGPPDVIQYGSRYRAVWTWRITAYPAD